MKGCEYLTVRAFVDAYLDQVVRSYHRRGWKLLSVAMVEGASVATLYRRVGERDGVPERNANVLTEERRHALDPRVRAGLDALHLAITSEPGASPARLVEFATALCEELFDQAKGCGSPAAVADYLVVAKGWPPCLAERVASTWEIVTSLECIERGQIFCVRRDAPSG
ncbi:MAG: hypothetical protein ACK47B_17065 [Armatimonadota bacterium]